jgi:hypothetical protein
VSQPSDPAPSAPSGAGSAILMVLGIIFVLPGICSVFTAGMMLADGGVKEFNSPFIFMFYIVWAICGLITWGGVAMIRAANRRYAARGSTNS